jgi:hypothetical protein
MASGIWNPEVIREHALRFGRDRFEREIDVWLEEEGHLPPGGVGRTWDRSSGASA